MALFGLFGNDKAMAAGTYAGRESADERNARKAQAKRAQRIASHKRSGATKAARAGQAWEDADRYREQYGRFNRRR